MPHSSLSRALACAAALLLAAPAFAQLQNGNQWPTPKLTSVFPPGGKLGTSVEVTFAGADLELPESLWFSHPGIKATVVVPPTPPVDPKKPEEKKKDPPAPTKFNVTIEKNVPPGTYDVRFVGVRGISNPRAFVVSDLNEVLEKEPNNDVDQPQKVEMGSVISGTVNAPTDVDYFQLPLKKGQRALVHCASASIDGKLTPELRVFDAQNRQLGYARAQPYEDTLLDFTAPADGDYLLRLNQFTYTVGTADHFYRLAVTPGPWLDAAFPPVVEAGKATPITIYGRGLPGGQPDPKAVVDKITLEKVTANVTAPADASKLEFLGIVPPQQGLMSGFEYRLGNSNPVFLGFAQAPVVVENDDNNTFEKAQDVKTPVEIVGRVDQKGDRDWFSFDAKKGDTLVIDAVSQKLNAPTDLFFRLLNAKKVQVTEQDDTTEVLHPRAYYSAGRDPAPFKFAVPEDGKYYLLVGSHTADIAAGPAHVYRVRIAPEKPDFQLVVMPQEDHRFDSLNVGKGGVGAYNVYPYREGGFKGDIELSIEGLPAGVTAPPQVFGPGAKQAMLAVVVSDAAPEKYEGVVTVKGTAVINGQKVVRVARPATVTWGIAQPQNATPTIARHDRALVFAIRDKAPVAVTPMKDKVVGSLGDKIDIPFKLNRIDAEFKGNFQVGAAAGELPAGMTVNNLTFAPGKDEQTLVVTTAATTPPGTYNLVLRGFGSITPKDLKKDGKGGKGVNTILPTAPVTLTIIPKTVANLTVDNAGPAVKAGGEAVLNLKVARLSDYAGEFKVTLLPENTNGVTAAEVTIPAGQNDAKLTLKAPDGAAPGPRQNLTLRAVAVVSGVTLNHDLKINPTVTAEKKEDKK